MRVARVLSAQPNVLAVSRSVEFSARFWLLLLATGVGAGLAGGLLMRLLYAVQHLAWQAAPSGLYEGVLKASPQRKLLILGAAGVLVAAGATLLRFAKGGHAGELTVALWFHAGGMPLARTLGRSVLSIVIVGLGAALGREGALKQTGAVIGWRWAHLARLSSEQRRLLTACGAGAGMAAAYNVPLGGALFALEVLLGSISLPYAAPAIVCSVLATVTSWLLLPMQPAYATPHYQLSLNQVGWAALAGPLIGVAAIAYVRLIAWADLHQPKGAAMRAGAPILVFLALGLAALRLPELLGNGKDVVQMSFDGGGGDARLTEPLMLLALVPLRAIATALCLRSGAPGGLFTPTMTCGALLGGALGRAWGRVFPADAYGSYAVVGSVAFLAAATEGPVSAIVTVLELSHHIDLLIVPILVASAGATLVMRMTDTPSIYSAKLRRGAARAAVTGDAPASPLAAILSDDFATLSGAAHPAIALQRLVQLQAQGGTAKALYIVDEKGCLVGRMTPASVDAHDDAHRPIEMSTASDLAQPVDTLRSDLALDVARATLARSKERELPVISAETGELIGVLKDRT